MNVNISGVSAIFSEYLPIPSPLEVSTHFVLICCFSFCLRSDWENVPAIAWVTKPLCSVWFPFQFCWVRKQIYRSPKIPSTLGNHNNRHIFGLSAATSQLFHFFSFSIHKTLSDSLGCLFSGPCISPAYVLHRSYLRVRWNESEIQKLFVLRLLLMWLNDSVDMPMNTHISWATFYLSK